MALLPLIGFDGVEELLPHPANTTSNATIATGIDRLII
jgi:hypothetical protein